MWTAGTDDLMREIDVKGILLFMQLISLDTLSTIY